MIISHGVVLTTALAAVICLPGVVAVMTRSGDLAIRRAWMRRARDDRPALHCLDRGAADAVPVAGPRPPLEQVAAELHRLHRQRNISATHGCERWLTATADAYDEWLTVACEYLSIRHHLPALDGIDRDVERLRIEAELTAAGLRLPR